MRRRNLILVFLAIGIALATAAIVSAQSIEWMFVNWKVRHDFPNVRRVSPEEVAEWLKDPKRAQPVLLNVRTKAEFDVSHIHGARRIEPGSSTDAIDLARDKPIVTYCSVGYRSGAFAKKLQDAGYKNVENMAGSIFQWANEGRPVEREGKRVEKVHPYNARCGKLLKHPCAPMCLQRARACRTAGSHLRIMRIFLLYLVTAAAEIPGCYSIYLWLRLDRTVCWLIPVVLPWDCAPGIDASAAGIGPRLHWRILPLALAGGWSGTDALGCARGDDVPLRIRSDLLRPARLIGTQVFKVSRELAFALRKSSTATSARFCQSRTTGAQLRDFAVDYRELLPGRFPPESSWRNPVATITNERFDLSQSQAAMLSVADESNAPGSDLVVGSPAAAPRWRSEQADAFIESQGGWPQAEALCQLTDGHKTVAILVGERSLDLRGQHDAPETDTPITQSPTTKWRLRRWLWRRGA